LLSEREKERERGGRERLRCSRGGDERERKWRDEDTFIRRRSVLRLRTLVLLIRRA
jgi:hypothetical protein